METHENIKRLREALGMSQGELAEKVGYKDRSSIAKIEAGRVDISQSKIAAFSAALHVSPAYLMGITDPSGADPAAVYSLDNVIPFPGLVTTPVIGAIACGEPILAVEDAEETVQRPDWIHADFALRCKGDSMINARIFDGDIVYIRRQPDVANGQIAAVRIGEEATLKRVYKQGSRLILRAANPLYEDMIYEGWELEDVQILGLAVAFTSVIK